MIIQIMDTTLRDGEQTNNVSFTKEEKLTIVKKLLLDIKVNRVEIASCRVSVYEQEMLTDVMHWANKNNFTHSIEVLSFCDYNASIDWLEPTNCQNINLLTKGSLLHCEKQIKKTPQEHLRDIEKTVRYAMDKKLRVSVYLEDWSSGMINSPDYVYNLLDAFGDLPFQRIYLPDTLGILIPSQVDRFVKALKDRYPTYCFEFHGHNDYGLGVANALYAVLAGVSGVHCTVNGLGERAGNTSMAELIATIHDHTSYRTTIEEKGLKDMSSLIETFSGKKIAFNTPVVGKDVFTQTAGIHADGDQKNKLYQTQLSPQRFNRTHEYALGKLSGKSNIVMNLKQLGIELSSEVTQKLLERVVALGDRKENITREDLPFIIADILGDKTIKVFEMKECIITSSLSMKAMANISVLYHGKIYYASSEGNGGFDAFMKALQKMSLKDLKIPELLDFEVHIPKGGKTDSFVETTIVWEKNIKTRAVSSDQVLASMYATERVINLMASYQKGKKS